MCPNVFCNNFIPHSSQSRVNIDGQQAGPSHSRDTLDVDPNEYPPVAENDEDE